MKPFYRFIISKSFFISNFIILFFFFISHFWFFKYLPLSYSTIDSYQYFSMQKLWDLKLPIQVGYPSYGYVLFLHCISWISDSLYAISLFQSLLSLLSVLILNYAIYKYIDKKYILWFGVFAGVFLAAPQTLFYNTMIVPDALLSSIYILFCAILIFAISSSKKILWSIILGFLCAFAIFIRPSSIFLLPLSILAIIYLFIIHKSKTAYILLFSLIGFIAVILVHNKLNPLYGTFNLFENSNKEITQTFNKTYYGIDVRDNVLTRNEDKNSSNIIFSKIIELLPTSNIVYKTKHAKNWEELFDARSYILRGLLVSFDSISGNILVKNHERTLLFDIDSVLPEKNLNSYLQLKEKLKKEIENTEFLYTTQDKSMKWVFIKLRKFYSYFYDKSATEVQPMQYGTIKWRYDLYSDTLKLEKNSFYTEIYAQYLERPDLKDTLLRHGTKELYSLHKNNDFQFEERYHKTQHNFFFKLYDIFVTKVHPYIFQTIFSSLLTLLIFFLSVLYLLFINIRSKTAFIVFSICMMLISLSMIHSLYFVYYRYTYASSFVFFIIPGILPTLIAQIYHRFFKSKS